MRLGFRSDELIQTNLVLVDRLVGDCPEACAKVNREEDIPWRSAVGAKIGPTHDDADLEHQALCQGKFGVEYCTKFNADERIGATFVQR